MSDDCRPARVVPVQGPDRLFGVLHLQSLLIWCDRDFGALHHDRNSPVVNAVCGWERAHGIVEMFAVRLRLGALTRAQGHGCHLPFGERS